MCFQHVLWSSYRFEVLEAADLKLGSFCLEFNQFASFESTIEAWLLEKHLSQHRLLRVMGVGASLIFTSPASCTQGMSTFHL